MPAFFSSLLSGLSGLFQLFFPHRCDVCNCTLGKGEEGICLKCNLLLPRTGYHRWTDNPLERNFWGKVPLERAAAYFFYRKNSPYRRILRLLKYGGRKDLGETLGRQMAAELALSGFFDGMDVVMPVPLHPRKLRQRGYNQSECIARGIAAVTGLPLDTTSVTRLKHTDTQTHRSADQRWENVRDAFALRDPERFCHRHILLVDDVATTTATLTACADAFARVEGIRISILTLALSG